MYLLTNCAKMGSYSFHIGSITDVTHLQTVTRQLHELHRGGSRILERRVLFQDLSASMHNHTLLGGGGGGGGGGLEACPLQIF